MKKLLVMILLVTMLLPVVGIAEFDFASMTDEQLIPLNKELAAELISRGKTAFIPVGWYVVGEDIPEGAYMLTLDPDASENAYAYYTVLDERKGDSLVSSYIKKSPTADDKVVLKNGNILEISYSNVYLSKSYGIIEFK